MAASSLAVGVVALSSGVAVAAPTPFTWSGGGGDSVWSDGANWSGGSAPQPKASVDLTFPELACGSGCDSTAQNDVTGLKVPDLSLSLGAETGNGDYNIPGNGIKVGTFDVTTAGLPNSGNGQNALVDLPMTLSGSETWSVDVENNSNLDLGTVQGANSDSLTVNLPVSIPGNFGGFINLPSINTGPLTFQGSSGPISFVTGGDFNGTSGQPVKLLDSGLFVTGPGGTTKKTTTTDYGPLTVKGSQVQFGNGASATSSGPFGINSVDGNASFDSATNLAFNSLEPGTGGKLTAGVNYPQVAASGSVKLGSANLTLFAGCSQAIGTKYTIVTGSAIKGTFNGIANGDVVQGSPDGSPSCGGGASAPFFTIAYSATAVTATVTSAPPAALPAHASAAPQAVVHQLPGGAFEIEG